MHCCFLYFGLGALLLAARFSWRDRATRSGMVVLGAMVPVSPLLVRNAIAFHIFTPAGLGAGTNLWEGIGETDRASEFGAVYGDRALILQAVLKSGQTSGTGSIIFGIGLNRPSLFATTVHEVRT